MHTYITYPTGNLLFRPYQIQHKIYHEIFRVGAGGRELDDGVGGIGESQDLPGRLSQRGLHMRQRRRRWRSRQQH